MPGKRIKQKNNRNKIKNRALPITDSSPVFSCLLFLTGTCVLIFAEKCANIVLK